MFLGVLGEFCTGWARGWACWESFVPVGPGGGCCWESFVPVEPGGGCCWESFVPGEWWIGVGSGRKFSLLARNGRISVFLGVLGEFCTGRARGRLLPGEFCTGWARAWGSLGAGLLCGAPLARKLADDGLLFGHADDAGALAQGQGCGHGHGAGAAREHEDNQHVFGPHRQDWGDAGGQADGREC